MVTVRALSPALRGFSLVLACFAAACGSARSGAATPEGSDAAESAEAPASDPGEAAPSDAPASGTAPEEPSKEAADAAPASTATPLQLCNKMCDRVAAACTKTATSACRTNCEQYEHPPAGCDAQVRAALECASKASDVTCTIIAPDSCAPEFRRVVACTTGKEDPGPREVAEARLPDGWERFEVKPQGFAAAMPKGASPKEGAKEPTFSVVQGQATYSVRVLPPPKEKPTQKSLVPFATKQLGNCARKLKLFGLIERPERTSIRYDSRCADGAEWRGAFVFTSGRMYVLQITSPAGVKVDADAFVYGFELL